MNVISEKGIALKFDNDKVFMRLYPQTDMLIQIRRETALYLYGLVNKYNNTICTSKWSSFWRKISQIERTLTVFFITSNSYDGWGSPLNLKNKENLPEDFVAIEQKNRLNKNSSVQEELEEIFKIYLQATITKEEVKQYWEKHYANTCEIIKKHNQFDNLVNICFEKEKIQKVIESVLTKEGYSAFEKPNWSDVYNDETFQFLVHNEVSLFSSTASQLASWKGSE